MVHGFLRTACATPHVTVADCSANAESIIQNAKEAAAEGAEVIAFPELCITGYTCSDLFLQQPLQAAAARALEEIAERTAETGSLIIVGLPVSDGRALYNAAAALHKGRILAIVPKSFMPNYAEFYERRHFKPFDAGKNPARTLYLSEKNPEVPFGTDILITSTRDRNVKVAIELCEDLWVPLSPSTKAALSGATVTVNLSASNEIIGKASYRRTLVSAQSAKTVTAYLYANAGNGESTTDVVFSGHSLIAENGTLLAESELFSGKTIFADTDIERIVHERTRTTTFSDCADHSEIFREIPADFTNGGYDSASLILQRKIERTPFVPSGEKERAERCRAVIELQAQGLAKRLRHTNAKTAVIGLSGGLDSTLALLVTARAFDLCGAERRRIISVTMPCFGTTNRTYKNACALASKTGTELREVRIADSVTQHFKDIGHDINVHDVTYENCQARERTQVLMDIANETGGLVIGTGDLSEQALGWATYNGDHMSMYGVNGSIPKTLVRYLVGWFADDAKARGDTDTAEILLDILDTPVSPELLPPNGTEIAQKTEEVVGPYELHDFFLYNVLRFGFSPRKIFFLARAAFSDRDGKEIKKWLVSFYRRFFAQQFKRSCMPDGAKVGSVNLSPRGDWRMPSDASGAVWIKEAEGIEC